MEGIEDYKTELIRWICDNYEALQAKAETNRDLVLAKGIFKTTFVKDYDGCFLWLTYDFNKNNFVNASIRFTEAIFIPLEIEGMCKPSEKRIRTCADCVNLGAWVGYGLDKTDNIYFCESSQCPAHANAGACIDFELKKS